MWPGRRYRASAFWSGGWWSRVSRRAERPGSPSRSFPGLSSRWRSRWSDSGVHCCLSAMNQRDYDGRLFHSPLKSSAVERKSTAGAVAGPEHRRFTVSRVLILSLAALALAAPSHHALRGQQKTTVTQAGDVANVAIAMLPMSTSSAAAKMHATLGQRALDMGHRPEATRHFQQAVAADPTSAFAQLGAANASTSFADYDAKLSAAAKLAPSASRAEQLQIAIAQKSLVNDYVGAEASARELIAAEPKNPRAHLALATVQQQMGGEVDARRPLERALPAA